MPPQVVNFVLVLYLTLYIYSEYSQFLIAYFIWSIKAILKRLQKLTYPNKFSKIITIRLYSKSLKTPLKLHKTTSLNSQGPRCILVSHKRLDPQVLIQYIESFFASKWNVGLYSSIIVFNLCIRICSKSYGARIDNITCFNHILSKIFTQLTLNSNLTVFNQHS